MMPQATTYQSAATSFANGVQDTQLGSVECFRVMKTGRQHHAGITIAVANHPLGLIAIDNRLAFRRHGFADQGAGVFGEHQDREFLNLLDFVRV